MCSSDLMIRHTRYSGVTGVQTCALPIRAGCSPMVRRAGRCPKHSLQDPWPWTLRGRGFCPRECHCGITITITITITTITTTMTQPASETPAAGLQRPLGLVWWACSPRELSAGPGLDGPPGREGSEAPGPSRPPACTSSSRVRWLETAEAIIVWDSTAECLAQDSSRGCCCPETAG